MKLHKPALTFLLGLPFLFFAWHFLSEWYFYRTIHDFYLFFILFAGSLILASWRTIQTCWRSLPLSRILIVASLLLFVFPWGELLRLNFPNAREDWSRQIFKNVVFLYGCLLLFQIAPGIPSAIHRRVLHFLEKASATRTTFLLPPVLLFLFSLGICLLIYKQTPAVNDASSYLFQAKIFAAGKLYAPAPPHPEFFNSNIDSLVMKDGKWFSVYPLGFPLLLAVAMLLKAQWFLDPLLGACTAVIWMQYAKRWHNKETALLFGLLFLFSPFVFQMFSNVIVHAPELFLASAIIYACRRELEEPGPKWEILLFVLVFIGALVRGFSLLLFLSPVLVYTTWNRIKHGGYSLAPAVLGAALAAGAAIALFQSRTTGDPWLPAYVLEYPDLKYGFGKGYDGIVHTPVRGVEQLSNSLLGLNKWLNGWYSGSVFFLLAFFFMQPAFEKWDRLLLLCCFVLVVFYFGYVGQDLIFGPRFLFLCSPFLLLLISRIPFNTTRGSEVITGILVISFLSFLPRNLPDFIGVYDPKNDPPEFLSERVHETRPVKKIVFLDPQIPEDYVNWNDPFLRDPVLIARDLGERNRELIAAFPDHTPVYFRPKSISFSDQNPQETYGLYPEPDGVDHSRVSFFQLAMTLQSTEDTPDQDIFDVAYPKLFSTFSAQPQLQSLAAEASVNKGGYKESFRLGLIHVARMLLLPRLAFEQKRSDWSTALDLDGFRTEMNSSAHFLRDAGETGRPLFKQIDKVRKRMDEDQDGRLSDEEILGFLSEKILLLARYV